MELWRWLPSPISTILAPTHPQRGLGQPGNTAPFSPPPSAVTLKKLLFAHVLVLQTSMSSAHTCLRCYDSHSNGRVRDWTCSPETVGQKASHPSHGDTQALLSRCKDGGCIGSIGCLGRKACSDLSAASHSPRQQRRQRERLEGCTRSCLCSTLQSPLRRVEPSPRSGFLSAGSLVPAIHTHILALSAKQFGNRYCNCVVSELVIDQLGVGLAYRSAGWQVAGKERRQTCTHAHPLARRSADAQQEKEGEPGVCRPGTAALQKALP